MKQATIVGTLLLFLLAFLTALGGGLFLWQEREELQATAVAQGTMAAAAEATLVQLAAERQAEIGTRTAVAATQAAQTAGLEEALAVQATAVGKLAAEVVAWQTVAADETQPIAEQTSTAGLQLRIWLENPITTSQVGQPLDIIASATDPQGIAALNIAVNGETVFTDSPAGDPPLHTVTYRYVPQVAGDYRLTAFATTARGGASEPVALNVTVIEDDDINREIRRKIELQVAEIRNLSLLEPIFPIIVNSGQLDERLRQDILSEVDREELRWRSIGLSAFDFVPLGYDLYEATAAILRAAVAGFYRPTTNQFIVVSDGDVMTQDEQLTYVHEFTHALQDQHYQLDLLNDRTLSNDEQLALRSLGEGEAELIEFLYQARGYLTGEELDEKDLIYGPPEYANVYDFIVDDFNFPYTRGYDFVNTLYQEGGFAALNQAWVNRPRSTEQILHPEKYLAAELPQAVTLPDLSEIFGEGWTLAYQNVLGEFYLREYLSLQLNSQTAGQAAAGWGGDYYAVYYQEAEPAVSLVLQIAWDTEAEQDEFMESFAEFAALHMGETGEAVGQTNTTCWTSTAETLCLTSFGLNTLIVRVADVTIARTIITAVVP